MKNILIAGGSGFIGRALTTVLINKGNTVSWLSRKGSQESPVNQIEWDWINQNVDLSFLTKFDTLINLAGVNIGEKRWNKKRKEEIFNSRVKATEFLFNILSNNQHTIQTYISASGVGYYGAVTGQKLYNESDDHSNDFLGNLCFQWEQAANQFLKLGKRVVILRTGVVLSTESQAFRQLYVLMNLGFGAALGSGKQYFSWIHLDDICQIYEMAVRDESCEGVFNAVAPEYLTNYEMVEQFTKYIKKPFFLPNVPAFIVRILTGEMSEALLYGSRISSEKLINYGFQFKYAAFHQALTAILSGIHAKRNLR
ncbi:MAG: TIGR01777 family oxidoreductase [Bacteroidota bacterium]|nr:TIGR01777 family oxidoreductase [Bacteroidota bacterium]